MDTWKRRPQMDLYYYILLLLCLCPQTSGKGGRGGGGRGGGRSAGRSGKSGYGGKSLSSRSGVGKFTLGKKTTPFSGKPSKEFDSYMKGAAVGYVAGHRPNYYFSHGGYHAYTHRDDKVCSHKINASKLLNASVPIENITVTNGLVTAYYLCDGVCCDGDCCYQKFWQTLLVNIGYTILYSVICVLIVAIVQLVIIPLIKYGWNQCKKCKRAKQEQIDDPQIKYTSNGDFMSASSERRGDPFRQTPV